MFDPIMLLNMIFGRATKRKNSNQLNHAWLVQIDDAAQAFVHLLDCWEKCYSLLQMYFLPRYIQLHFQLVIFTLIPNLSSLHRGQKRLAEWLNCSFSVIFSQWTLVLEIIFFPGSWILCVWGLWVFDATAGERHQACKILLPVSGF